MPKSCLLTCNAENSMNSFCTIVQTLDVSHCFSKRKYSQASRDGNRGNNHCYFL